MPATTTTQHGSLAERLEGVRGRIADAARRAGRDAGEITLVAVTKYAAPDAIREAVKLGLYDLGENRAQQLQQRAAQFAEASARQGGVAPRWHMIGRLQRNKVKALLPHVAVVQSVDSLRLAEEIDTVATKLNRPTGVMLQLNASEEPQKGGVAVGAAVHLAEQLATMPGVRLVGVMTMAEHGADEAALRKTFARTREVFQEIKYHGYGGAGLRHLSMGMSDDFELAIEEGSTLVRVGTALFGGKPEGEHEQEDD